MREKLLRISNSVIEFKLLEIFVFKVLYILLKTPSYTINKLNEIFCRAEDQTADTELCTVYYAPLNFRDIMLATGKLPPDALPGDLAGQVSKATLTVSL